MMPTFVTVDVPSARERRDEVAEAAAQVGHLDVGAVQLASGPMMTAECSKLRGRTGTA